MNGSAGGDVADGVAADDVVADGDVTEGDGTDGFVADSGMADGGPAGGPPLAQFDESVGRPAAFDPLRLCVFTTVAVIAAVAGPVAVLVFALIAIRGYWRARQAGLMRSKCKLGDTRLVLAYLSVLAIGAAVAIPFWFAAWARVWS